MQTFETVNFCLCLSGLGSLAASAAGVTATVGTAAGTAAGGATVSAAGGTTAAALLAVVAGLRKEPCLCIALLHGFPYVRSCTVVHGKFSSLLCLCPNSCLMSICQQVIHGNEDQHMLNKSNNVLARSKKHIRLLLQNAGRRHCLQLCHGGKATPALLPCSAAAGVACL